jgi:hypothetical protein
MDIEDLVGTYSILGTNQNDSEVTYSGTLKLSLKNNQIIAKWFINKSQEQFGIGFYKNKVLVINFNYIGDENTTYYGTVVYKCLNKDILEGFWSEEFGDPNFLGSENCFRIKNSFVN